jgi:hypothetical protein
MSLRQMAKTNFKVQPIALDSLKIDAGWTDEPSLTFAGGRLHPDPKVGIPLYGPRSLNTPRHKAEIHVGFIGPSEAIESARKFYEECAPGLSGDSEYAPFPGCQGDRGFRCDLRFDPAAIETITRQEQLDLAKQRRVRDRFELLLDLTKSKLEILTQRDRPLDYVVFAISEEIYRQCRVTDYVDKGKGTIHRDLRRAFKAQAMNYLKPTQILLETTTKAASSTRELDHISRIAWNLFTGMYFKVDGLPWGPTGLAPATCFIGISFFRPLGSISTLRASVVQAFDENGEGLVLRGHNFHWNETDRSPHVSAEMAQSLIDMVLARYQDERKQLPQRVVLHKTSRFESEERAGFENALSHVAQHDLVALTPVSEIRLARAGRYPPLRGTNFNIGDDSYLYTSGYLESVAKYPHGHVPSPLQITDHVGDTPRSQLLREILILTKMNWNSANFAGLLPITLRFSKLVGDILREVPEGQAPQPKYKYYM